MALDITLGFVSCLMAFFGVYVTFWPPVDKSKKKFLLGFVFLLVVSVIVIVFQAINRKEDQAKQDMSQSELRAQNVELQANVNRLLFPIKDISVTFRIDVPLVHPDLAGYRARLERCAAQIVSTQRVQCGATSPIRTAYPAQIEQICISPGTELYPQPSELLAYSILSQPGIVFTVYKAFSKELYLRRDFAPDLSFFMNERLDSPDNKKDSRVSLCYEIKTKTLFLRGTKVPVDPQGFKSNGKIIAISDLRKATFLIHPMTFLAILKEDERGTGVAMIDQSVVAMQISETTTLRNVTLHFSNGEDIEMSNLAPINRKESGIESRIYLYEPQAKMGSLP